MVAVWNPLLGTTAISKFKDRKTAAQRLWTAFAQLPVEPEPITGSGHQPARSKQAQVIGLLQRPVGSVRGRWCWQRHLRGRH
jgi:hypothetical protein